MCSSDLMRTPHMLTRFRMLGVRITAASLLAPRMGLVGVWLAMCVELCVRGVLFLVRLLRGKWLDSAAGRGIAGT